MNRKLDLNPHHQTDQELIQNVLTVDRQSFRVLYERYYAMAVGVARSHVYDVSLAEDVAQESFAIAFETLSNLRDQNRFGPWIATICRRTAIRLVKSREKEKSLTYEIIEVTLADCKTDHRRLSAALTMLDEVSREIIMLHYFSELSYQQISETLSISQNAIHGRLQRARKKLKTLLTTEELPE